MKKLILFLMVSLSFSNCSDNNNCCANYDTIIYIKYLNEVGENLFDINNGYSESDIIIYHKIEEEWEKQGNLTFSNGITVIDREDGSYLKISPSITLDENNYSETKIEFSDSDFDILKTEIYKSGSSTIVDKVWYNEVLEWEAHESERTFEIIK